MNFNINDLKDMKNNLKKPEVTPQTKNLIKLGLIIGGIIIGIFILLFVVKLIIGTKVSNEQLENIMVRAAKKYVADNPDAITDEIFGETEITTSELIVGKYMKEMTKYKGKETTCGGSVIVFKNNDNYSYTAKLECDDYEYLNLASKVTAEENLVQEGNGLYYDEINNTYTFRGEYVDNFVKYAGQMWRILKVDADSNIRMLQVEGIRNIQWDNRYNINKKGEIGINVYEGTENSRIKDVILDYYNNPENFSSANKSIIIPKEYCVGSRTVDSGDKSSTEECMTKSELMGLGGPNVSELMEISLDVNCTTPTSDACKNYNFINYFRHPFWTLTPVAEDTFSVYVDSLGTMMKAKAFNFKTVNVVVTIDGNIKYKSGTGTESDPYIIQIKD